LVGTEKTRETIRKTGGRMARCSCSRRVSFLVSCLSFASSLVLDSRLGYFVGHMYILQNLGFSLPLFLPLLVSSHSFRRVPLFFVVASRFVFPFSSLVSRFFCFSSHVMIYTIHDHASSTRFPPERARVTTCSMADCSRRKILTSILFTLPIPELPEPSTKL